MNRHKIIILTISITALLLWIFLFLYSDRIIYAMHEKPTLQLSIEDLDTLTGIRFFLPADENHGLNTDIYATLFDENELMQYLIVPKTVNMAHLVCYACDEYGNYLSRHVLDFSDTDTCALGIRTVILRQTALPTIMIDIAEDSPTFDALVASDKTVECHGEFSISDTHQQKQYVTLKGRGNASWDFSPKKSFTMVFKNRTYIAGLGKHKKWNLISNAQDKSLLNNEIFLQMASDMGIQYEPKCEQVTLYVNGEYQGVYLLTSKVSVDRERVNLQPGDFLINFGGTGAEQPIFYESQTWMDDGGDYPSPYVDLVWPKNDTKQGLGNKQRIIQQFISSIEDPGDNSYTAYMDLDSMVRYYWVQEISMNYDAAFRSTYAYYKANTGKITMGPVWDLDLSLGWRADKGGADYETPEGWKLRGISWYVPLFAREEFREAVIDAYWNGGVRESMLEALERFEQKSIEMNMDGTLDYLKWRADWPALGIRYGESYSEQTTGRLQFFKDRVTWIDSTMQNEQ